MSYDNNETILVYITCPDFACAKNLANQLLKEKLIACANVFEKIHSMYVWKEELINSTESVIIAKTNSKLYDKLQRFVINLHPYECPCVVAMPISHGSEDFLTWVNSSIE